MTSKHFYRHIYTIIHSSCNDHVAINGKSVADPENSFGGGV